MIPQVDRVVIKDIFGPWVFGVGLFSALLMAATYLGRLAGFIVDGVAPMVVVELVGLLMPAVLVKTFTMSVLLATLLGFGRLSSDSEIVALRAAGASVYRIVIPVVVFSVCIAGATFVFNEKVVPVALARYQELQSHLIKTTKMKAAFPISRSLIEKQRLQAFICAENINPASQTLQGVTMIAYDEKGKMAALMFADKLDFKTKDEWVARGNVRIVPADFSTIIRIPDEVWPSQIPKIHQSFLQITAERDDDFDSMTLMQLRSAIIFHKQQGDKTPDVLHNYEYGYWTKIAVPMAAITFGVLGAVLGIRNHRTGTAAGFALAVAIIFGYVTLANFMNVWAIGGVIPAWMAAFAPLVVGAMAALVILWQRNG